MVGGLRIYRISTLYQFIVLEPPTTRIFLVVFLLFVPVFHTPAITATEKARRVQMKIKTILTATICAGFISGAFSATKCVNLPIEAGRCTNLTSDGYDWSAQCSADTTIRGIGVCSSQSHHVGDIRETLPITASSYDKYCWCKMTYPVLSDWIAPNERTTFNNNIDCIRSCANTCVTVGLQDEAFTNSLYRFNHNLL